MAKKPVILTVDDDPAVLRAVERDLRRRFGREYRVLSAESGEIALRELKRLILRNDTVALFLVDQRMPQMTGVEFLEKALDLYPDAKRVLLTAYADTEAAIRAINEVNLDYYLMKPWDPPEERLYPVMEDLLDDWQAAFTPPFEGIRVVGHRWSSQTHDIKDFLARNLVPYRWIDMESDPEAEKLFEQSEVDSARVPLVLFPDGSFMVQPTPIQLASKIGLQTAAQRPMYDLVIIGAGPAGLAAAVYAASEGLETLMIERRAPGGQAGASARIENYLGFPRGLSGEELARRAVSQAVRFGAELLTPQEAVSLNIQDLYRVVTLGDGSEVVCRSLLIATGVTYRLLDVPGIEALAGAGVYYGAASTEAASLRGDNVFIVGGGNSAGQAAVYLAQFARKVTMLVRGETLAASMSKYLIDRIEEADNIEVRTCSRVTEVHGQERLEAITLVDITSGDIYTEQAAALFVFIGASPNTDWLDGVVQRDPYGFLLSDSSLTYEGKFPRGWKAERQPFLLECSVPGVFAAGDVRFRSMKRVASAVGEGAMAVSFIHRHLATM